MRQYVDEVRYSKSAKKFIESRNSKEKENLRQIIEDNLKKLPETGDIKRLRGYSDGRKRLRVGSIRIIYKYSDDGKLLILFILDIGNRGDVYK